MTNTVTYFDGLTTREFAALSVLAEFIQCPEAMGSEINLDGAGFDKDEVDNILHFSLEVFSRIRMPLIIDNVDRIIDAELAVLRQLVLFLNNPKRLGCVINYADDDFEKFINLCRDVVARAVYIREEEIAD